MTLALDTLIAGQMSDRGDALAPAGVGRPSREQWELLLASCQPRIARLAYRLLGWRTDLDDIVQEVFVRALLGLDRFRGDSRLETWLVRITINVCRSHARRRSLLRWLPWSEADEPAAANRSADGPGELLDAVRRAIARLPSACREAAVLHFLEQMPIEEIAAVLGHSRNTIDVRLARARAALRRELASWMET